MNSNFFDQDEGEFRDMPDEVSGKSANEILQAQQPGPVVPRRAPATPPQQLGPQPPEDEYDVTEQLQEEDEDDYSAVLSDARLRLEQGRLYEMILNHDIFEDTDADPAAIKHVQRQVRKFAKEQMEIMLGMRKETTQIERLEIDFPFNTVEVQVLKMVASKASGGKSENSDKFVPEVTRTTEEVENVGKKKGLSSISVKKPTTPVKKASPTPPKTALKQQPNKPVARKSNTPESILVNGDLITREQIDTTFNPNYEPLTKPVHEMNADDLLERNRQAAARIQKTAKNPSAVPMPTFEQEAILHQTRMMESSAPNSAVNLILNAMNQKQK